MIVQNSPCKDTNETHNDTASQAPENVRRAPTASTTPFTRNVTVPDDLQREINLGETGIGTAPSIALSIAGKLLKPLSIEEDKPIVLGRADPLRDSRPDVDLTPYDAAQHGVSRRHARIVYRDNLLRLEDLNSMNGTFLNGMQLQRHDQRILRSGDHIQLGSLRIRLQLS